MTHELFPSCFSDNKIIVANKLLLMEKAAKIIAVSNNTKSDILKLYPHIDSNKIEVIYHGNSIKVHSVKGFVLPSKYILFVGSREHYKNFIFLVEAIQETLNSESDLILMCAGGGKFTKKENDFLKRKGLLDKVIQKPFTEKQLGLIYQNAIVFVFPSIYEGFGIPVLESMACSCPVVLTENSSFPEVAGDAGVFFKLDDKLDLRSKIEMFINTPDLRDQYIKKGLKRVKEFTWDQASDKCLKVYKEAIILSDENL